MDTQYVHLLWIIPLLLLIVYLGSPRFHGQIAVNQVRRLLAAALEKSRYTALHQITLPSGGGTRGIDHVIVSQFGIFVVEVQYRNGWISGTRQQDRWKQANRGRISRFPNPVYSCRLDTEALQRLLGLPASKFHSFVVFSGHKGFKTDRPENVLDVDDLVRRIRSKAQMLLSIEEADEALNRIIEARINPHPAAAINPWQLLRLVLTAGLLAGIFFVYQAPLKGLIAKKAPVKTEQQAWEDSLICAFSADTGRCACYEKDGRKLDLPVGRCQELAERGSVLKQ